MAGIDKVYGTPNQWWELNRWLRTRDCLRRANMYGLTVCFHHPAEMEVAICNNSQEQDMWLMKHCPLRWLRARLKEQYGSLNYRMIKKYDKRYYRWYKRGHWQKMEEMRRLKHKYCR